MSALGRIVGAGIAVAVAMAAGGAGLERSRFGATDDAAVARVQAEVQTRFDQSAAALSSLALRAAAERPLVRTAARDTTAARQLFEALDAALPEDQGRTGITIYDTAGAPLAWAGRVSDPPRSLAGPASLIVTVGALGPRLIRIEPLADPDRRPAGRLATVVVEQILDPIDRSPALGDQFTLSTSLVPVALRVAGAVSTHAPALFSIRSQSGGPLVDVEVDRTELAAARARWRRETEGAVLAVLAITLMLCAAPLVDARRRSQSLRPYLAASAGIAALLLLSRAVFRLAATTMAGPLPLVGPLDLLLTSLVVSALVWLAIDLIEARRRLNPRARLLDARATPLVASAYFMVGLLAAGLLWMYDRFLQSVVSRTTVDLLHFSLHPFDVARLGLTFGLVLLHASAIWTAAGITRFPTLAWRVSRGRLSGIAATTWMAGTIAAIAIGNRIDPTIPAIPLALELAAAAGCALALPRLRGRARRLSQSMRLGALFLALLVPALAVYPLLSTFATQSKERLIATQYGPLVVSQRDDLQTRLQRSIEQIDAFPGLSQLVTAAADPETANRSFVIWSQTDLERYRVTSAVELYGADGRRLSRFALILPEYGATTYRATGCDWELTGDVSPIGADETHVLRATRGVCVRGRPIGAIVVRAMLDYRTLPFISSRNPYLESLRPDRPVSVETVPGRDVEFVFYGWSRAPLFASGTSVWTLPDAVFQQTIDARSPFWADVDRAGQDFRIYFLSDRGGIYALGYPVIALSGHLINLAELVTLAFVLFILLVGGATLFNTLTSHTPVSGHALLREIRSSFYRKLRLAFVLVSVVPVVILAVATRTYFANELNAGIEDAAARTVTVAQRLVEDYASLQQRGPGGEALDDDVMVLVSRAIDEDVNLFDGPRLQATSALDLYASQLLSTRTPADVYERLQLERAPTYVGEQEVGTVRYLVAAAPVHTATRDEIVTVPVTLRPQEIERETDELDRRVLFGAVLFSLLGGALGYWMAERIADPVNRLTRATRRIARGDFDARIARTSADELGRLVRDFNQMAADLQRQRSELEHTQRLQAWADMARQVAHDIKNPLTPIQLSAEHARRVNLDRGGPLSPVLDECVAAILSQVKLLRQIAVEFSSFASSPTPHPEPTALPALLAEVLQPYRTGLAERIEIQLMTPDDLPSVPVDRTLFARALTNLIENALYAMPGTGRLIVTIRRLAAALEVEVADTGVGMDEEALAKMFQPYFSTKATGTGLGLTIAKRNIELLGGTIRVASQRGVGTTVTLTLPVGA